MSANATDAPGGLRELRRTAALSQQQVAVRAECSIGYVRLLERGFEPRRSDVLPRVLAVLHNGADPAGHRVDAQEVRGADASDPTA